jgi:sterol desaturase/sphingolipid hydroxylase (fatty acid hydroxylase superfamily)
MNIFETFYKEIVGFFQIENIIDMVRSGDYSRLRTFDGILRMVAPIMPVLLLIEMGRALLYKKFRIEDYRLPFFIFVANRFISRFISIAVIAFCISILQPLAPFQAPIRWYWLLYGYIIWELSHFVYHYLAHKVRLLWCLHSTHHAPESMNLSVTYAHFFLEAPYADLVRSSICLMCGLSPELLFLIMFFDGTWGAFIHVGEHMMKTGRMGFLEKIFLSPAHHRMHHARNPVYMDTNFCNLLNFWDRVFGTWKNLDPGVKIEYGITRPVNTRNFWDVYFGEIVLLFRDMAEAPGIKNKVLYALMPPGWSHTGDHKTARVLRQNIKAEENLGVGEKIPVNSEAISQLG